MMTDFSLASSLMSGPSLTGSTLLLSFNKKTIDSFSVDDRLSSRLRNSGAQNLAYTIQSYLGEKIGQYNRVFKGLVNVTMK